MTFMIILAIIFAILVFLQAILVISRWSKKPEFIDGKTLIELLVIADQHMSDSDKLVRIAKLLNEIDFSKIETWQLHAFFNKINEIKNEDNHSRRQRMASQISTKQGITIQ